MKRYNKLVGGPNDGMAVSVEAGRTHVIIPRLRRVWEEIIEPRDEVYQRQIIVFGDEDDYDAVEFFAHISLSGEKAARLMWDHLLRSAGVV